MQNSFFLVHPIGSAFRKKKIFQIGDQAIYNNMHETLILLYIPRRSVVVEAKTHFLLFNKHLVFHKNWGQYNPYVKATLSNFRALRSVSAADG